MIITSKMWGLEKRIEHLGWLHKCDPNDYMIEFELQELKHKYAKLTRIECLGLKLVQGGLHPSKASTEPKAQSS